MYNIYESFDSENQRSVYGTPDTWETGGILLWPPANSRNINRFRKNKMPPGEEWQRITSYKLLAKGIPTFRGMLAKERMYEQHSDSESAAEAKKRKAQKRRHPVNHTTDSFDLPDFNSDFETISTQHGNQARSIDIRPIETVSSVNLTQSSQNPNVVSNFDDRNMVLGPWEMESNKIPSDLPSKFRPPNAAVIPKQTSTSSSVENWADIPKTGSIHNSNKKAKILSVEILNNGCDSKQDATEDISLSVLDIMNLPIDYVNGLPSLSDTDLSELYAPPTDSIIEVSSVANDVSGSELTQNFRPPLSQLDNAWTIDYETKLSNVEKKLAFAETQLNRIEANQVCLKAQNENLLKLVAALHVKIDGVTTRATPQPTRKDIPADVQKLVDNLPVQNKLQFEEFRRAYKNKIALKDALFDQLKLIGGADEEKCTKRTLSAVFSDDVLMDFTWFGTSTKAPFKDYEVHNLIKDCVRVHYAGMTDANYQAYVQDHLKYAFSRVERRYL